MNGRRVAITGLGVVSAAGIGVDAFWDGICSPGVDGVERRIEGFDASAYYPNTKEARRADRSTQFAIAASQEAIEQAGGIFSDPARSGVIYATGVGGMATFEEQVLLCSEKGERRVSPFLVPMMMPNASGAAISMRWGLQGPNETITTACAAGTHSIGYAARLIAMGRCDTIVTGGCEAAMTVTGIAGFRNMTALSNSGVSRPFDKDRDGFVMTEAAGVLVLEEWDAAEARGANILAEVVGAGSNADAHHITAPTPGGAGAVACMQLALDDAGLEPEDIVHINAHGTSTPLNDMAEAESVAKLFGTPGPAVTSIKGVTGHSLGAAGAIEAVALTLSMERRLIPPTSGFETLDPEMPAIDVVHGQAREWTPGPCMSNSLGFGGHNGSLLLAPPNS
ncbi:MAG: beta-ketoacyl-ACP synthase II [Actinomycetia bacterium]|nr:beta-ketoacyl-ACP synthase II [Actinomycetes bacterium]MCP4963131.1 beta-ketoacyl-ACP synthase II [Actinomycetes bacterium]